MVAAANPLATDAGYAMLRAGGNAIDATIAVQLVLGLVEPQSSGLGGGAFLLYHDARSRQLIAYDGRETAPAAATPGRFLGADGKPLAFYDAVVGGRSVGVPGTVKLLETVHRRHVVGVAVCVDEHRKGPAVEAHPRRDQRERQRHVLAVSRVDDDATIG